jgi:hypothetical protein
VQATKQMGLFSKLRGCLRGILFVFAVEWVVNTPEMKKLKIMRKKKNIFEMSMFKAYS